MSAIKTILQSDEAPSLGLFGSQPNVYTVDAKGDLDAASLCLTCKGATTGEVYYSLLPWTTQTSIPKTSVKNSPAVCSCETDNPGHVWVWKDAEGTGMSWAADNSTAGVQSVPNHAHTDQSPAVATCLSHIDPQTGGIDYNLFTLFWKGDSRDGGNGSDQKLWSMSNRSPFGWGEPVQIPGAKPSSSPSVALQSDVGENTSRLTLVWADLNGQIWLTQSADDSGDAQTVWTTPAAGPTAFTLQRPGVTWFDGNLMVAWTLQGLGWIMYSMGTATQTAGVYTWSNPALLCKGQSGKGPALAEHNGILYVAYRGLTSTSIYYETFNSVHDLPKAGNPAGYALQINNTIASSFFTGALLIGKNNTLANLIIDTGSSSLAVLPERYEVTKDPAAVSTSLALEVKYDAIGSLWWIGPIIQTVVALPLVDPLPIFTPPSLPGLSFPGIDLGLALYASTNPPAFQGADGIMGLAYTSLSTRDSTAYDFSSYLAAQNKKKATNPWPWPFSNDTALAQFAKLLSEAKPVAQPVPPCFTQFEQEGLLPNKFALWVNRAAVNQSLPNPITDPSNWGFLVLGGGEDYFVNEVVGPFQSAAIVDDAFYYLNLVSAQVGNLAPIPVAQQPGPPLTANALVDSGTPQIQLEDSLWLKVFADIGSINAQFTQIMRDAGANDKIPLSFINLNDWPVLTFTFSGTSPRSLVTFHCYPNQYWQSNAPSAGLAQFMLTSANNQSIFGLAFLTGYYAVFDRSVAGQGIINFAPKTFIIGS